MLLLGRRYFCYNFRSRLVFSFFSFFLASPQAGSAVEVAWPCTVCSIRGEIMKSEVVKNTQSSI